MASYIEFSGKINLFREAYNWLCQSRKKHPPDADIWDFRRSWGTQAGAIMAAFWRGTYRFGLQKKVTLRDGETVALWPSADALVIKVLTRILQARLQPLLSRACYHLQGHGGLKGAVREVLKVLPRYRFFCKTDVRSYYDSIDHCTLLLQLHEHIRDRTLMGYLWQFLNRCVEWGGLYQDVRRGIGRGASLSPLLGAWYLRELDRRLEGLEVKYFRYMDDILILAETRWKLKKAIRVLNRTFDELKLAKHPDKTAMGRVERGFDFLGYHFTPTGLSLAARTLANRAGKALRLYEQEPPHLRMRRLGEYLSRWHGWALGGGLAAALAAVGDGSVIPPVSFCGDTAPAGSALL
jgi:RNA-directed DNA polymerase